MEVPINHSRGKFISGIIRVGIELSKSVFTLYGVGAQVTSPRFHRVELTDSVLRLSLTVSAVMEDVSQNPVHTFELPIRVTRYQHG